MHGCATSESIFCVCPQQKDLYDQEIEDRTKLVMAITYGSTAKFKLQSGSPSAAASSFAQETVFDVTLQAKPLLAKPCCDVCGLESKAKERKAALQAIRRHRLSHLTAPPLPAYLTPGTGSNQNRELSALHGARSDHQAQYFDGLLTAKFAELVRLSLCV